MPALIFFFLSRLQFQVHSKFEGKVQRFPIYPLPHTFIASCIINIPHQSGAFVVTDEPTMTHHNHPKSIASVIIYSWCCTFYGFGQTYNDTLRYHAEYIQSPKNFLCSAYSSSHPHRPTTSGNYSSFTVSIVLPYPVCHVITVIQYAAFSDWLLSLSNIH